MQGQIQEFFHWGKANFVSERTVDFFVELPQENQR